MKIYYAHHLWKYNTPIEEYELLVINNFFKDAEIINPNGNIDQSKAENQIMVDCLSRIKDVDALVFSSMSGVVGHGVYDEVNNAFKLKKNVYYLINNNLINVTKIDWKILNQNDRIYALVDGIN